MRVEIRRLLAGALVLTAATTVVAVLAHDAPRRTTPGGSLEATSPCADAVALVAPGSAQGTSAGDPGTTLRPLTEAVVAAASASGRTVETRVSWVDTAAAGSLRGRGTNKTPADRAVSRTAWRAWHAPVGAIATGLRDNLRAALTACPDELVYLFGFSQGAEAVHRVIATADADLRARTVAAVLVSDPARVGGSGGARYGDPAAPRRASGVSTHFLRTKPRAEPDSTWLPPLYSFCTATDLVCDLGPAHFGRALKAHHSYTGSALVDRLGSVGQQFGHRLSLWPKPPPSGQTISGRQDLLLSQHLKVQIASSARSDLRWTPTSALPPGLRMTARGVVTGTPTQAGSFPVTYTVRNTANEAVSRPMPGQATVDIQPGVKSQVSSGGRHTCSVHVDGTLWCWGANFYGQLGNGSTSSTGTPVRVGSADDWESVSAGGMHTCGVRDDGTLWCWGLNYRGQLGVGDRADRKAPTQVGSGRKWESVSAGWVDTCATRTDGTAWCWGNNDYGQLGDGTHTNASRPRQVSGGSHWREVRAGGWHSCGVKASGVAFCWGRNQSGQVGDGTLTGRSLPRRVGPASDWLAVEPGWTHTCGLHADGTTACWGGNEAGQLGTGDPANSTSPVPVAGGHLFATLTTGIGTSCGLDTQAELWCWGTGRYGELGSDTNRQDVPVAVAADQSWGQVDLGWLHACGLQNDATTLCWGNNETGQLGDGTVGPRTATPTKVATAVSPVQAALTARRIEADGLTPVPPTEAEAAGPTSYARQAQASVDFNLVSFNVLGSNHTTPRKDAGEFSPARVRMEWLVDYLGRINASVVGFQEIQRDQLAWFNGGAGSDYAVWPGTSVPEALQTNIAWRRDTWRLLDSDTVQIPFITQKRRMPLVHLENKVTGKRIWVMNIHNAPRDYQAQRDEAVRREIARLKDVVGHAEPVLVIGDFNERQRAFCQMTGKLDLVAPRGGSFSGGTCHPPDGFLRIDWIFGSKDATYSGYTEDKSPLVKMITDHAVLRTHVSVP